MPDNEPTLDAKRDGSPAAVITIAVVLLLVAYVLGLGPVQWLMQHGYISERAAIAFYWPLAKLCEAYEPLAGLLAWYQSFWMP